VFAALDRNKDGKISKDEASGVWADNFGLFDKNGDGAIDRQ
jgi:Ca2+-binding EF-hand superfamily protein